jgi:hypothetical protein
VAFVARLQETFYRVTGQTELLEAVRAERAMVEHLQESMSGLEARMFEPGWVRMTASAEQEFSREGLRQITAVCRIMAVKNSLIKRGVRLRTAYVWGQGVQISGRDADKKRRGQDVNAVVQDFLDDPGNLRTFSGQQAREELEQSLGTDGNVFLALFTNPRTGRVQVRDLPWDEIADVITNPEDSSEPWYYKRVWQEQIDPMNAAGHRQRVAYYPALGYKPLQKPLRIKDPLAGVAEVLWDAPVVHVKVNGLRGDKFGLPDVYAAIDWAHAYKDFLTDWATLIKALSRFAWKLTSTGSKQAAAKARLASAPGIDPVTGETRFAGAAAIMGPGQTLEAIPKSGASIDSESGRPLAAMAAAALDVPVTMLLGDPGVTGARATAETLDKPTELMAESRRALWTGVIAQILAYVIAESVRAPEGVLRGKLSLADGRELLTLRGRVEGTIDITWPAVDQMSLDLLIDAIVKADGTQKIPPLVVARLLLEALGLKNVDEVLSELTDDKGEWLPPSGGGSPAGKALMDRFRNGEDPAAALNGEDPPVPAEAA